MLEIAICWSIHQPMNIWVISIFWLVWIMRLWTSVYNFLCGHVFISVWALWWFKLSCFYPPIPSSMLALKTNSLQVQWKPRVSWKPINGAEQSWSIFEAPLPESCHYLICPVVHWKTPTQKPVFTWLGAGPLGTAFSLGAFMAIVDYQVSLRQ